MTSIAEILGGELCLSPTWGAYNIGCQGKVHYPSGERGVAKWFVVVGRQGWQGMSQAFQKVCSMSSTHWGYSSSWTSCRAKGFSMFCVWEEERSSYYVLVLSMSTWLAYGMLEATNDLSTSEIVFTIKDLQDLVFLSFVFVIPCGFHRGVPLQLRTCGLEMQSNMRRWN
jgi:hypothetical protein